MKKIIFFTLFTCLIIKSQEVTILTEETHLPVQGIILLDDQYEYVGITDLEGTVQWDQSSLDSQYYLIDNPQIESDTLYLNQLKNNTFYVRELESIQLNDLAVTNSPKEYLIIEGYFTDYVTNDHSFNIFVDGIMRVVVNNKTFKIKDTEVLQYRVFKLKETSDPNSKELDEMIFDTRVELPSLKVLKNYDRYAHKITKHPLSDNGKTRYTYYSKNEDFYIKVLGYEFSNYLYRDSYILEEDNIENLRSLQKIINESAIDVKHKNEKEYNTLREYNQFYTIDSYYLSKKELKARPDVKFKSSNSYFTEDYWSQEKFATAYKAMEKFLESKAELQENKAETH